MRQNAKVLLDRVAGAVIVVCGVITCVNFVGLAIAFLLISDQAGEGADARARQQAVYPVSLKLYSWAATVPESGITAADLACFRDSSRCPAPKPTATP